MWNVADVLEAKPVIVLLAANTCFKSNPNTVFAAILTAGTSDTPSSATVAVIDAVVGLATTIFVITALLPAGTVYRVVLVVAAAVRARALVDVAIITYL